MSMANRGVLPKFLQNLPYILRRLNSAPSSSIAAVPTLNFDDKSSSSAVSALSADGSDKVLDFSDVKGLFSSVSTPKLIQSSATLHMASIGPMVDLGTWVMNSRLMDVPLLREVILQVVRRTFYEHFVAGENLQEVCRTVTKLSDAGLRAMLDYGLEHATHDDSCDRNMNEFLQTVESIKYLPPSSVSFVVVKVTAICPLALLKRVSDLLRWEYKDQSFKLPWKLDTLPIFADSSPLYHTPKRPEPLTPEEERSLQLSHNRLAKICEKCIEANVPLLIDAEDTTVQPAIDYFAYSSAVKYHKDGDPLVFATIQAYLKDAKDRLVGTKKAAAEMGVPIGFKLVRGAYMSSESQLASSLGVESPIQDSIHQTHACYNECASFMLEEIAKGSGAVVLATHNVESGRLAATKAIDLGINKGSEKIQFAQLYGMSEALSLGLRNSGFQVSKYLPFGPIDQIMPYLLRRAEENRGLLSSSTLDKQLMSKELKRRLRSAIL